MPSLQKVSLHQPVPLAVYPHKPASPFSMKVRMRLASQLNDYRTRTPPVFTDVRYSVGGHYFLAHKLVLARYSSFFRTLFAASLPGPVELDIPFDESGTFQLVVDFLYTGNLNLRAANLPTVLGLFMISIFYGIAVVTEMLRDVLTAQIREKYGTDTPADLAGFCALIACYRRVSLAWSGARDSLGDAMDRLINASLTALRDSQSLFTDVLSRHLLTLLASQRHALLTSITPFLLSRVLKAHKIPNEEAAALIEGFMRSTTDIALTAADLTDLNAAIDWEDEDAYRLFSEYALDWVDSSIARRCLARLVEQRTATLSALSERVSALTAGEVSRWFASSWLLAVRESAGNTVDPPVELLSYISRFGGSGSPSDPVALGFLANTSSPSLGTSLDREDGVGVQIIFDSGIAERERGRWHFVSVPCNKPQVGARCVGFEFRVEAVVFEFSQPIGTLYHAPKQLQLDLSRKGKTVLTDVQEMNGATVDFNVASPVPCSALTITMVGDGKSDVLRADAIRVIGVFMPEVPQWE
jgi:hypothetical protein